MDDRKRGNMEKIKSHVAVTWVDLQMLINDFSFLSVHVFTQNPMIEIKALEIMAQRNNKNVTHFTHYNKTQQCSMLHRSI